MKKFFVSAMMFGAVMAGMTSCGAGDQSEAQNDTIFSEEFTDSFTTAQSNALGADLARQIEITQELTGETYNKKDFLKGIQQVVGTAHSSEYLDGIEWGRKIAMYIDAMKSEGLEMDRDEVLKNIRRLVMADSIPTKEYEFYGSESERFGQQLSAIMFKREMSRAGQQVPEQAVATEATAVPQNVPDEAIDEMIEVVEDLPVQTPDTVSVL